MYFDLNENRKELLFFLYSKFTVYMNTIYCTSVNYKSLMIYSGKMLVRFDQKFEKSKNQKFDFVRSNFSNYSLKI